MANLIAWLLAAAWPIAKRVLVMLGIGVITYQGLTLIATQATNAVVAQWGNVSGAMLQIASLGGVPQSIGIILSAIAARAAFVAVGKLGKLAA